MIDNLTCIHETHAEEGTGAIATSFAYTWHSGTFEIEQQTITLPAVPTCPNGSGASAIRNEWFDAFGRVTDARPGPHALVGGTPTSISRAA